MKFKHYISVLLLVMLVITLTGCGLEEKDNKDDGRSYLFTKITIDKSETLDMNSKGEHYYYYLKDTGVVYVGYILNSDVFSSNASFLTPVISENGNYYKYDKDKQTIEEIIK